MKIEKEERETRRIFLEHLAGGIAGLGFVLLRRSAVAAQGRMPEVLASIKISQNGELEKVGGHVLARNTTEGDVIIVRTGAEEFTALSNVCPHKQCLVEVKSPAMIRCPCHQSAFKIDGTYISGPAKASLRRFQVRVDGDSIAVLDQ